MKLALLTLLFLIATTATAADEKTADITLGKIKMRNITKLDTKARSDVATVAAKIKKMHPVGVVKVRGDFPGAENAGEYLSKSVFMAREVEKYLNSLLSSKFQVFVIVSSYSGAKRSGENSVEILLYPHQLLLEEVESLRFVSTRIGSPSSTLPPESPVETVRTAEPAGDGSLLSAPREETDDSDFASKKALEVRISEDAALANELVIKAKARAAEKARRRATED